MQFPEFNHTERKWDEFKEFHNNITPWHNNYKTPFVLFESGEFIITSNYFNPSKRKQYQTLNLSLFMTRDMSWRSWLKPIKFTTPDGDEIKRSWLEVGGSQTMVHDHDSQRTVRLGWTDSSKSNALIPLRFRSIAYMYCAGKGEPPIGRSQVAIRQPDPLNKEENRHVRDLVAACKAWHDLSGAKEKRWSALAQSYNSVNGQFERNDNYVEPSRLPVEKLLAVDYNTMSDTLRVQLAKYGLKSRVKTTHVPYLNTSNRY